MVRRAVRKNIKKTVISLFISSAIIATSVLFVVSIKNLLPILKFGSEQKNSIIRPVSKLATYDNLSKILNDKNIIMESLVESSTSSLLIGQIKDGPKVYFSKQRDPGWQVLSLELILNKFTIDNKKPTLVDLRFEQPIVKF